jgi:hypothetical protein
MTHCDFRLHSSSGDVDTVVCVNCGRPVRAVKAASRRILAHCNGEAETRWRCHHGEPVVQCKSGSALKALLASIGITAEPGCSCQRHANEMDRRGCDWCEQNIDTIVGWLREEATKRGLPFIDAAGRLLVRRAISNARKQAKMKQ